MSDEQSSDVPVAPNIPASGPTDCADSPITTDSPPPTEVSVTDVELASDIAENLERSLEPLPDISGLQVTDDIEDESNPIGGMYVTTNDKLGIKIPGSEPAEVRPSPAVSGPITGPTPYDPLAYMRPAKSDYTLDEIIAAADSLMKGRKISLQDPVFISEVIEELTSRRIDRMMNREYLKAQAIIDKIADLKSQFQTRDLDAFLQEHKLKLEARKQEAETLLKESKRLWKAKLKEEKQIFKEALRNLEEKQELERQNLDEEWTNPAMQRQFNKQSKYLLEARVTEKFLALSGHLVEADQMKRQIKKSENREVGVQAAKMKKAFEDARNRLEEDLTREVDMLNQEFAIRREALVSQEYDALQGHKKKLELIELMIGEEKIHASKCPLKPATKPLPMLVRTAQNIKAASRMRHQTFETAPVPLPLPPLKAVKRPKKPKVSVENDS
jgi:hypothetical protein